MILIHTFFSLIVAVVAKCNSLCSDNLFEITVIQRRDWIRDIADLKVKTMYHIVRKKNNS